MRDLCLVNGGGGGSGNGWEIWTLCLKDKKKYNTKAFLYGDGGGGGGHDDDTGVTLLLIARQN